MAKNLNSTVGDSKSPPLAATETELRKSVDHASKIQAEPAKATKQPSVLNTYALALDVAAAQKGTVTSCRRSFWLSFFFDGTGNNLDADLGFSKHSNITRLYRAHKPSSNKDGILSVYIPGIGTYFPEVGDHGGSALGLGCGAMGEERLDFALAQFDTFLKTPLKQANSAANAIDEINIAVFGFSRGAALARAFVSKLMEERCVFRGNKWALKTGAWPVRFRFLGLFDTVASVGMPMSTNTTAVKEAYYGDIQGMIAKRFKNYGLTRPRNLAFSADSSPGADPAPGSSHGHGDWGSRLEIHGSVEEVRHFVAAHEIRNSFPVDSISILSEEKIKKPSHFYETIYPGAHSDVGGGYAPGEGGRSFTPKESLSLIPLRSMYDCALRSKVPMLVEQGRDVDADFLIDVKLCQAFASYTKKVGSFSTLGDGINRHMALYYAWKFRSIKHKLAGDKVEAETIQDETTKFDREEAALAKKVEALEKKEAMSLMALNALTEAHEMQGNSRDGTVENKAASLNAEKINEAREKYKLARHERLKMKALWDTAPKMSEYQKRLSLYERQLMIDVHSILERLQEPFGKMKRSNLRPHYKALLAAYEDEFEKNNGLKDEQIIGFFDNYVHDSLAGFGKDATLPSDPRVVYLGGDLKYKYADLDSPEIPLNSPAMIA